MQTDPVADYLTRIRNAILARHRVVSIPSSRLKVAISAVLKEKGFIRDYRIQEEGHPQGLLQIAFKYDKETRRNSIMALKRISRPGLREYVSRAKIPRVLNGLGIAVLSTSRGVMSGNDARRANLGGEVLCHVY